MENEISQGLDFENESSNPQKHSSFPLIAGILLIIACIISITFWAPVMFIDIAMLESVSNLSQIQEVDPSFTIQDFKSFMSTCALIVIVLSVFPLLGGILSIGRKLWGIALAGSIIGLFTIFGSIPSLIAMILLIISRQNFK